MTDEIGDDTARAMRAAWFAFIDAVEPHRARLHVLALRLTGSIWDAEDLVQESLLRGFAAIGRGDLHGEPSRLANPAAYLCQVATNLWIDQARRARREVGPEADATTAEARAFITPAAGRALFERASPQQRAAVVLKDVFDFRTEEIAEILTTTEGAVKSALHRGRANVARASLEGGAAAPPSRHAPASAELIDAFVAAFNARDMAAITGLLLDGMTWEVLGVGGERGRDTIWLRVERPTAVRAERRRLAGLEAVVFVEAGALVGLHRIEAEGGRIARIVNYAFCPETLSAAGEALGLPVRKGPRHQDLATLSRMIADSNLPWWDKDGGPDG